jgi:iron complex transport system substrate-binding protein
MSGFAGKMVVVVVFGCAWAGAGVLLFGGREERPHADSEKRPERIVSMGPNLTEIMFAMGLGDRVVGVTRWSNYPEEAKRRPSMGTFWQPNVEAIISVKPDLVVTLGFDKQMQLAERLGRLGYRVLAVDMERMDELFAGIVRIGEATGNAAEAERLASGMQKRIGAISSRVCVGEKPKVLWVIQMNPLRVAGCETFANELIELGGGVNAIGWTINKYPPIGPEQVIAMNPDVIIGADVAGEEELRAYFGRFENVEAVKKGRLYVVNGDVVSRLGSRVDLAVETAARCVKPEMFED